MGVVVVNQPVQPNLIVYPYCHVDHIVMQGAYGTRNIYLLFDIADSMDLITGEQHGSNEEIVIEPFSLNDIKCNTTDCEFQNSLPLETDGTQIKYFSAAMGVMGSKRKRESSISSSLSIHKQAHSNWRHALLKARSQSDPWEAFHLENYPTEKALRHRYRIIKKM